MEKLHIQSEGGLAILRAKGEDDDKFRDRVEELCRKLGIIDAAAPLSMETLELLEQRIIIAKENQPPSATSTVPLSQAVVAGTNPITPMDPLPNASLNYTRRPRRKVTRNNVTDNMTVKAPQVLNNPEPDVLLRETRRTETTIETSSITHRVSSRGTETALPSQRRPTQNDYHSVAVVPESQTLNTIVPLSHIEDGNDHVAFTSPLADLSHLFPRTPVGSQKEIGSLDSAKKELQKNSDAAGSSKDGASSRKNVIVYSNDQVQAPLTSHLQRQPKSTKDMNAIAVPPSHSPAHKTATKREVPREPGTSTAKAFDLFPDFSSPSTDHLDRTNLRARTASSGNIIAETAKREKVYNSTARGPAPKSAFSKREIRERQDGPEKNASGPAGVNLAIGPRSQTSSMLPLAHRGTSANNTKLSGGSGTTRGILKNPISTFSGKRGLESVEAHADDPKSRSKRPKAEIDAATSSVVADSQSPSAFRQSNSIRSLGRQQHTYSPSQTARGTTNRQRKRSQTSGGELDSNL